jgi:urea transport system permease protein
VVTGGVGDIAGAVCAGLGLGVLTKVLEPVFSTIWAKVLILTAVIVFIQYRPAGLFPPRGRQADA